MLSQDQLNEIVDNNIATAVDQAGQYTEPDWTAADAYSANAIDTVLEKGGTPDQAGNAGQLVYDMVSELLSN